MDNYSIVSKDDKKIVLDFYAGTKKALYEFTRVFTSN